MFLTWQMQWYLQFWFLIEREVIPQTNLGKGCLGIQNSMSRGLEAESSMENSRNYWSRSQRCWKWVPREQSCEWVIWKASWPQKSSTAFRPDATLHHHTFQERLIVYFFCPLILHSKYTLNKYWFITQAFFLFVFSEQSNLTIWIAKSAIVMAEIRLAGSHKTYALRASEKNCFIRTSAGSVESPPEAEPQVWVLNFF